MAGSGSSSATALRARVTPRTTARFSTVTSRRETKSSSARQPVRSASIIHTDRFETRNGLAARSGRADPPGREVPRHRFTAPYRPTSLDRAVKTTSAARSTMKSFDALYGEIQALPKGQRGEILTAGEVFVTMGRPGRRHRWATQSLYANLLERDAKVGGTGWWIEIDHRAHDRGRRGEHHSAAVRSQARRPPPLGHRRETDRNGIVFSVRTWKSSPPTRWSHNPPTRWSHKMLTFAGPLMARR
jgi:hypothetical protein